MTKPSRIGVIVTYLIILGFSVTFIVVQIMDEAGMMNGDINGN